MVRLRDISADTLVAPWTQRTTGEGLVAMLAIGVLLAAGYATGHTAAGAIAAGGALTVGFAVFNPIMGSSLISMLAATLAMASATFAGSLSAEWTWAVLVTVAVGGINYGLLSALSVSGGWVGQQAAVYLVISTYFPNGPRLAASRASMILLGGALQIAVHLALRRKLFPRHGAPIWKMVLARSRHHLGRVPEHLQPGSASLDYVARMMVTMVAATAIYRGMGLKNGYWVPMTAVLVLKPTWGSTISRSLARLTGTLGGATIAFGLARFHHWTPPLLGALIMVCALACYALQAVNYALFSLSMTLYIVFLFRFGGFNETAAAHLRLLNTAIGGVLALLIDGIWQVGRLPFRAHSAAE